MWYSVFLFFNDTATTENYTDLHTLSQHDALPISAYKRSDPAPQRPMGRAPDSAQAADPLTAQLREKGVSSIADLDRPVEYREVSAQRIERAWPRNCHRSRRQRWATCSMPSPRLRCRSRTGRRSSKRLPPATSSRCMRSTRWPIVSSSL